MNAKTFRTFLIISIFIGLVIRIACYPGYYPEHGAVLQTAMGRALFDQGTLTMQYGDLFSDETSPMLAHHFPPVYPVIIGAFTSHSKDILTDLKLLSLRITLITALIIFLLTKRMFGDIPSLFVTSGFMLHGALIDNASKCLAENIQILLIVIFLAAVWETNRKSWFWVPAGFVLGLAYLSKSTLPFWFTIALVAFTAIYISVKNRKLALWLLSGLAVFILTVLPWGIRNYINFGSFETSEYIASSYFVLFEFPSKFLDGFLKNLVVNLCVVIPFLVLFHIELKRSKIKDKFDFFCMFFSLTIFATATFYSASFYALEDSFLPFNSIRYVLIAIIPLMFLIVKYSDFFHQSAIKRSYLLISILLLSAVASLVYACKVTDKPLINEADWAVSRELTTGLSKMTDEEIETGKTLQILFYDSVNKNDMYYYLFAVEESKIKNFDFVRYGDYEPACTRSEIYYDVPAILIHGDRYRYPVESGRKDYSKYARHTFTYWEEDSDGSYIPPLDQPGWCIPEYIVVASANSAGNPGEWIDRDNPPVRIMEVLEYFWSDFFVTGENANQMNINPDDM